MTISPSILFHGPSRIGLGHINRLAAIAHSVTAIDQSIRVSFAIDGPTSVLLDALQLPYIPLPNPHAMRDDPSWACWRAEERALLEKNMSEVTVRTLHPTLAIFDCFPSYAVATAAIENGVPIVLCLRKMKDVYAYLNAVRELLPHVRLILIPHTPGAFELPKAVELKSRFVGEIVHPRAFCLKPSANQSRPNIIISGGGGGYPGTVKFYNLALRALLPIRDEWPDMSALLVTGPLFSEWEGLDALCGVHVIPFVADMPSRLSSADLVICQGGYNTIAELLLLGVRSVCVPAHRDADDQFERAEAFVESRGNARLFLGDRPEELTKVIREAMRTPRLGTDRESEMGARNAAQHIYELLHSIK